MKKTYIVPKIKYHTVGCESLLIAISGETDPWHIDAKGMEMPEEEEPAFVYEGHNVWQE